MLSWDWRMPRRTATRRSGPLSWRPAFVHCTQGCCRQQMLLLLLLRKLPSSTRSSRYTRGLARGSLLRGVASGPSVRCTLLRQAPRQLLQLWQQAV
jgi:hypothetical protein